MTYTIEYHWQHKATHKPTVEAETGRRGADSRQWREWAVEKLSSGLRRGFNLGRLAVSTTNPGESLAWPGIATPASLFATHREEA